MNLIDRDRLENLLDEEEKKKVFRMRSNPWDTMTDLEFRARFRLSIPSFLKLANVMKADLETQTLRSYALSTEQSLAIFLYVLSGNAFQISAGDVFGVSQSKVSKTIALVSDWFTSNVSIFVKWPEEPERKEISRRIFDKYGLPDVVGFIDGTHVRILAPKVNEYAFVNRKGYHSLNVSALVDDNYKFRWFDAKYPGSSHDSTVFKNSALYASLLNGSKKGRVIGDSAYQAEKFLLKIITEQKYNDAICASRATVEQSFGQVKRVFHSLHGELRYEPARASKLVASAICLRNYMIDEKQEDITLDHSDDSDGESDNENPTNTNNDTGRSFLKSIALNYFRK